LLIDASTSAIDNVEHVYLKNLPAGRYEIEVSTDREDVFCLTWDFQLAAAGPQLCSTTRN